MLYLVTAPNATLPLGKNFGLFYFSNVESNREPIPKSRKFVMSINGVGFVVRVAGDSGGTPAFASAEVNEMKAG